MSSVGKVKLKSLICCVWRRAICEYHS